MKVDIKGVKVIDNIYVREGKTWSVLTLIEASKDLEPFDLPLAGIDLGVNVWSEDTETVFGFAKHVKRVQEADLKYPIILSDRGFIADGWHRVVKAIMLGRKTIKAVRLTEMPAPDSEEPTKESK